MSTSEILKRKIDTAQDLHSVVKTMKAVSAVSIRQYEKALVSLADYDRTLQLALQILRKKSPQILLGTCKLLIYQLNYDIHLYKSYLTGTLFFCKSLTKKEKMRVIVVGGGAAGFLAAIACAQNHAHSQVLVLEAATQPLTKVKISGGGRCNVTHHCFNPAELVTYYPRGGKELRGAFSRFQPQDTVKWFAQHGVKLKTEADGRMFPVTNNSQTIIECLTQAAKKAGVKLLTRTPVKKINKSAGQFLVELKAGQVLKGDRLLIATGSNPTGYRWAEDLGHTIHKPVPSLFTFKINDPRLENLAGLSIENVYLRLLNTGKSKIEQQGALLITHWGISGPAVLKLSAWGARILFEQNYKLPVLINWLPQYKIENLRQHLLKLKQNIPRKKIISYSDFPLPKRLWQRLISMMGIGNDKPWAELSKKDVNRLIEELTRGVYHIEGKGVFKEEFVTCGGVNLKEVNFKTMESKICLGLYFAGEVLDIDGITGGFNFQSAWTTGWLAGQAMGVSIVNR